MPTERPAWREADGDASNRGGEAPWIEPASRSASKPVAASLRKVRTANLSEMPKPATRREATFTGNGGVLRGRWGQRAGKGWLGRLGDPRRQPREERGEARAESIRRAPGAGESERPMVAMKRGNARGAKGPWHGSADSDGRGADWRNPTTANTPRPQSEAAIGSQVGHDECSESSAMRKPDAGNLQVRFDEGEGSQRTSFPTLPLNPEFPHSLGRRRAISETGKSSRSRCLSFQYPLSDSQRVRLLPSGRQRCSRDSRTHTFTSERSTTETRAI